jgi:hypothetical protein
VDWGAWWGEHGELVLGIFVGGIISAIVSWIYYRKAEKPKRLAYEIRSNSRMISTDRDERQNLQVIYNGARVKNPNLTVVRVANIGKQDIVAEDFRNSPIKIRFDSSLVLSATPSDQQNPRITGQLAEIPGSNAVGVMPDHLKSNEWFDIRIVTDGDPIEPEIEARVVGETHPVMATDVVLRQRRSIVTTTISAVIAAFAIGYIADGVLRGNSEALFSRLDALLAIVALLTAVATIVLRRGSAVRMNWAKKETPMAVTWKLPEQMPETRSRPSSELVKSRSSSAGNAR